MQTVRRLTLLALVCGASLVSGFLVPLNTRIHGSMLTQPVTSNNKVWGLRRLSASVVEPTAAAPVLPGMAGDEIDDVNEYYEPEPVDPTIDELKEMSRQELAHVLKDGRTVQQWLDSDRPTFTDGGLVGDWIKEAHRLRLLPFLERAEHLKALSFDDLNLFRARQVEWRDMLEAKGVLEPYQGLPDEGVRELSDSEYAAKLEASRAKYGSAVAEEEALLKTVDGILNAARFEGTAMDNQVRVVMNGRMVPISVDVKDGALKDARILSQGVEAALESAYRMASEFYEETMATEYVAKAKSPTDLQGIVEALGKKEYTVVADVVDPHMV